MRVVIESPYAAANGRTVEDNVTYARECMTDCIRSGEVPFASHLLYTQPGVLDDDKPNERFHGIWMGYQWGLLADKVAFYIDHGMSPGMNRAKLFYEEQGMDIELRSIK